MRLIRWKIILTNPFFQSLKYLNQTKSTAVLQKHMKKEVENKKLSCFLIQCFYWVKSVSKISKNPFFSKKTTFEVFQTILFLVFFAAFNEL